MKPIYKIIIVLSTLVFCEYQQAFSQVTVQVIRKKYEDRVDVSRIKTLSVAAEKSDIKVIATSGKEIIFEVIVATKHPQKKQVIEDYKKMKFLQKVSGQTLYLRSYLLLEKDEPKPKSNFETTYIIYLPKNLSLSIKNTFGKVTVEGAGADLNANLKFCNTTILKSDAMCLISANYGNLKMSGISNDVTINSKHTSIDLQSIEGNLKIDSDYGRVSLRPGEKPKSITLKGNKTEVDVELNTRPVFGIKVTSKDTKLSLPDFLKSFRSQDSKSHFLYKGSAASELQFDTYLGSLTIK